MFWWFLSFFSIVIELFLLNADEDQKEDSGMGWFIFSYFTCTFFSGFRSMMKNCQRPTRYQRVTIYNYMLIFVSTFVFFRILFLSLLVSFFCSFLDYTLCLQHASYDSILE